MKPEAFLGSNDFLLSRIFEKYAFIELVTKAEKSSVTICRKAYDFTHMRKRKQRHYLQRA